MRNHQRLLATALILTLTSLLAAAPATLARDSAATKDAVSNGTALLDIWIREQLAYNGIPGIALAVVHDQEMVWSKAYGLRDLETTAPLTPTTPFRIGSVSKIFTSTAIMQLRDRGELRLDEPVSTYLPWFTLQNDFPGEPEITVRNLLTHTAGLPREGAFPYWTTHDFPTREELQSAVPGQSAVFPPYTTYKYSNLGMALLGEVIMAVSGEEYSAYIQKNIFDPLGMSASTVFPSAEKRAEMATPYMIKQPDGSRDIHAYYDTRAMAPAAEIVSTVEDMARFAALHLHDSSASDMESVLRSSTTREMQRPHWVYPSWNGGRGLGFGISRRDGKTIVSHGGWIGGNRSHLLLIPSEKIAVLAMTNADDASPYAFSSEVYDVLGPVIAKANRKETKAVPFDPAWKRFTGVYSDPWGWKEEVMVLDGKLVMYSYSYPPDEDADSGITPLTWVEGNRFKRPAGEFVTFEMAEDGSVARVKKRSEYLYPVAP
jgi:CubicO group peptidase (beta-lactamase class C family)